MEMLWRALREARKTTVWVGGTIGLLIASCRGTLDLLSSKTVFSCCLHALTWEASVPHPLSDVFPVGDGSPMCQSLCHCLNVEQETIVEGGWDDVLLQQVSGSVKG